MSSFARSVAYVKRNKFALAFLLCMCLLFAKVWAMTTYDNATLVTGQFKFKTKVYPDAYGGTTCTFVRDADSYLYQSQYNPDGSSNPKYWQFVKLYTGATLAEIPYMWVDTQVFERSDRNWDCVSLRNKESHNDVHCYMTPTQPTCVAGGVEDIMAH